MKLPCVVGLALLSGCASYQPVIPEGMKVLEVHHESTSEIERICGDGAAACAFVGVSVCEIHLPLDYNGTPLHRIHELRHCAGWVHP
jgi:hypothetical protein